MDLTDLATVKAYLKITDVVDDPTISLLIKSWSMRAEKLMNRQAENVERTKQFDVGRAQGSWQLPAYGSPETVISTDGVVYDLDRDFPNGTIVEEVDFYLEQSSGRLGIRVPITSAPGALQVTWTGGMADNTTQFLDRFPDISDAVAAQVAHIFGTRRAPGTPTVSVQGNSINVGPKPNRWIGESRALLRSYRNMSLVSG